MAGGAYPNGSESCLILEMGQVNIQASKTNWVWDVINPPFGLRVVQAQIISEAVAITNEITINVFVIKQNEDIESIVSNQPLSAITAGDALPANVIVAGASEVNDITTEDSIAVSYTSGASDTSTGTRVRLIVRPI